MYSVCAMRQIKIRNVTYNIELMKWSHKMDLLAISTDAGEVIVQRLNGQRIWSQPPPADNVFVRGIAWRPDEKIIGIGYSNGLVLLLDIENQKEIYSYKLDGDITCFNWTQNSPELWDKDDMCDDTPLDNPETYLPTLPNLNLLSPNTKISEMNTRISHTKNILNFLIIGQSTGQITIAVFGILPCATIDIRRYFNGPLKQFQLIGANMSADFRRLHIFARFETELKLLILENDVISKYGEPLIRLTSRYCHILSTLIYIEDVMVCLYEAWEKGLLEMDNKLSKYAESLPYGTMSAEFLEMLVFGIVSESMEKFLTRDLTEKGLKKMVDSIEICYLTMQKLIVKPLHCAIINIFYNLNIVKGMAKNTHYYRPFFMGDFSNDAILNTGSFLIKSMELQQTIESCGRDFKLFSSYLYGVIVRLLDEGGPEDVPVNITQRDINNLASFLGDLEPDVDLNTDGGTCKKRFSLERVGQYLKDENLTHPVELDATQKWKKFLNDNECIRDCELIFPHHSHLSLSQQFNMLKHSVSEMVHKPSKYIGDNFELLSIIDCIESITPTQSIRISHINSDKSTTIGYLSALVDHAQLFIIKFNTVSENVEAVKLAFEHKPIFDSKVLEMGEFSMRDHEFYNENILSILLSTHSFDDRVQNLFVQFPMEQLQFVEISTVDQCSNLIKSIPFSNMYHYIDLTAIKHLDGYDNDLISVSGHRKVSSILSQSRKRIRIYEMEIEDDDEELDTTQPNNSFELSKEVQ